MDPPGRLRPSAQLTGLIAAALAVLPGLLGKGGSRKGLVAVVAVVAAALGYGVVDGEVAEQAAQQQAVAAADTVVQLCDRGRGSEVTAAGGDCAQAREVVATEGTVRDGADGRDGTDGEQGAPGRGIATLAILEGDLVVTYTDGEVVNLGLVVGVDGRGIMSLIEREGRLLLTYTDGETVEFQLPPGPDGPPCPPGFSPMEARGVTGADGRTYERAISCVDPDSVQPAPTPAPAPAPTTEPTPAPDDPPLVGGQ